MTNDLFEVVTFEDAVKLKSNKEFRFKDMGDFERHSAYCNQYSLSGCAFLATRPATGNVTMWGARNLIDGTGFNPDVISHPHKFYYSAKNIKAGQVKLVVKQPIKIQAILSKTDKGNGWGGSFRRQTMGSTHFALIWCKETDCKHHKEPAWRGFKSRGGALAYAKAGNCPKCQPLKDDA